MITEDEIDKAIAILEDPQAMLYDRAVAMDIVDEYIEQANQLMCISQNRKAA